MEFGDCDTGFGAHTAPSHGSSPIGLPTKLLRSNKSADEAAEASENSTNPQRISGVSLILPRIRCHVRALEEVRVGAWGLGCSVLRAEDVPMELEERTQQRGRCVAVDVAHFDLGFLHEPALGVWVWADPARTPALVIIRRLVRSISPLSTGSPRPPHAGTWRIKVAVQPCFRVMAF